MFYVKLYSRAYYKRAVNQLLSRCPFKNKSTFQLFPLSGGGNVSVLFYWFVSGSITTLPVSGKNTQLSDHPSLWSTPIRYLLFILISWPMCLHLESIIKVMQVSFYLLFLCWLKWILFHLGWVASLSEYSIDELPPDLDGNLVENRPWLGYDVWTGSMHISKGTRPVCFIAENDTARKYFCSFNDMLNIDVLQAITKE